MKKDLFDNLFQYLCLTSVDDKTLSQVSFCVIVLAAFHDKNIDFKNSNPKA